MEWSHCFNSWPNGCYKLFKIKRRIQLMFLLILVHHPLSREYRIRKKERESKSSRVTPSLNAYSSTESHLGLVIYQIHYVNLYLIKQNTIFSTVIFNHKHNVMVTNRALFLGPQTIKKRRRSWVDLEKWWLHVSLLVPIIYALSVNASKT